MMDMNLSIFAGTVSTIMFGFSTLPMLTKAVRTKDLHSYSLGNILLANGGNIIHSLYVFSLPPGPIWFLHSFYLVTTGLMLTWYLRYEWQPRQSMRVAGLHFPNVSSVIRSRGHQVRDRPVPLPRATLLIPLSGREIPRPDTPSGA